MSMKLLLLSHSSSSSSLSQPTTLFSSHSKPTRPISTPNLLFKWAPQRFSFFSNNNKNRMSVKACVKVKEGEKNVLEYSGSDDWGKVSAVLFDMDGVLCNSEEPSRKAAVEVFAEMGVETTVEDFIP